MAEVEVARNEIADPEVANRFVSELNEAASASPEDVLGCAILDEGLHFEIEVEVPGWTERVAIPAPARPGDVRRAVARVLREFGLVGR
jgi:hypothetical protein